MRGEGTNPTRLGVELKPTFTFSTSHNQEAEPCSQHTTSSAELRSALLQPGGSFASAAPELEPGWQCSCCHPPGPPRPLLLQTLSPILSSSTLFKSEEGTREVNDHHTDHQA